MRRLRNPIHPTMTLRSRKRTVCPLVMTIPPYNCKKWNSMKQIEKRSRNHCISTSYSYCPSNPSFHHHNILSNIEMSFGLIEISSSQNISQSNRTIDYQNEWSERRRNSEEKRFRS